MDVLISIKSQSPNLREYDIWNLQNISNDFKGSELRPQHPNTQLLWEIVSNVGVFVYALQGFAPHSGHSFFWSLFSGMG